MYVHITSVCYINVCIKRCGKASGLNKKEKLKLKKYLVNYITINILLNYIKYIVKL